MPNLVFFLLDSWSYWMLLIRSNCWSKYHLFTWPVDLVSLTKLQHLCVESSLNLYCLLCTLKKIVLILPTILVYLDVISYQCHQLLCCHPAQPTHPPELLLSPLVQSKRCHQPIFCVCVCVCVFPKQVDFKRIIVFNSSLTSSSSLPHISHLGILFYFFISTTFTRQTKLFLF